MFVLRALTLSLLISHTAFAADTKASAAPKAALSVVVVQAQPASWAQTFDANGSIAAWLEAIVGAQAQGLAIASLNANIGDHVKKGALLAQLDSQTVAADLAVSRANLAEAKATEAEAIANADRARQLQPSGVLSAQQTTQMLTAESAAKARTTAYRARVSADEVRMAQTRILAPDDGIVSARLATLGAVVQPGQELFRLIRQSRLEWRAEVSATDLAQLRTGQTVAVTPERGTALSGKLRLVSPTVDPTTRNALVYVDLPAATMVLPGMFARGQFQLGSSSALSLPQTAVVLRDGFAYVFKVGNDNRVSQTKVAVGRRNGARIEIVGGLDAKTNVVESGAGFLADGDVVKVVPARVGLAATGQQK